LNNSSPEGATLYCTTFPCSYCSKAIINAKIRKIIYLDDYNDDLSLELLKEAGIEVIKVYYNKLNKLGG
jgi:dCMP deaminase